MMMMKKTVTAVLLLAMLAATGCASSDITVGTGSWDGEEGTTAEKSEAASELTDVTTKVFTTSYGTTWVVGIATVKNTGDCDLYISDVGMDIEDASGSLVDTMSLPTATPKVISPSETAVLYGTAVVDAEGDYKVVPTFKAEETKIPNTRFAVSDVKVSEDDFGTIEVIGRVENDMDEEQMMTVAAIFYAADGSVVGMASTTSDSIAAGGKSSFKISTLGDANNITLADVDHYDVIAYPWLQMQF